MVSLPRAGTMFPHGIDAWLNSTFNPENVNYEAKMQRIMIWAIGASKEIQN